MRGVIHLRGHFAQHEEEHDDEAGAVLAVDAVHQDGVVLQFHKRAQRQGHTPLAVLQQGFVQSLVPQEDWIGHSWGHH